MLYGPNESIRTLYRFRKHDAANLKTRRSEVDNTSDEQAISKAIHRTIHRAAHGQSALFRSVRHQITPVELPVHSDGQYTVNDHPRSSSASQRFAVRYRISSASRFLAALTPVLPRSWGEERTSCVGQKLFGGKGALMNAQLGEEPTQNFDTRGPPNPFGVWRYATAHVQNTHQSQ